MAFANRWVVEFVVPEHEMAGLDWAATRVVGPRKYWVGESLTGQAPSTINIEVSAPSRAAARQTAIEKFQEIRESAQLPTAEPRVSMVAVLAGVPLDADEHIFSATRMKDEQRFELAIIEAQTHCEMHIGDWLAAVAERLGPPFERLVRAQRTWSLMDPVGKQIFEALLGEMSSSFERWEDYKVHVQRRNNAAHRGVRMTAADAEESIAVAVEMVRFVEDLAKRTLDLP